MTATANGHLPESNWGDCAHPFCKYACSRCSLNFCASCCRKLHGGFAHTKPWVYFPESTPIVAAEPVLGDMTETTEDLVPDYPLEPLYFRGWSGWGERW